MKDITTTRRSLLFSGAALAGLFAVPLVPAALGNGLTTLGSAFARKGADDGPDDDGHHTGVDDSGHHGGDDDDQSNDDDPSHDANDDHPGGHHGQHHNKGKNKGKNKDKKGGGKKRGGHDDGPNHT